jgi:hypothetical protein
MFIPDPDFSHPGSGILDPTTTTTTTTTTTKEERGKNCVLPFL